ncbi:CbtA family protein [Aureimonas leprariae]|uniref:CbtA family protein n=1 Tax=Plantimonas leprariae TaxID=2615207 RepID=A0A7V7TVF7_9HYPH|nr:CbtA family protein [Aureimonas leprariae]KAB0678115.1 CbtA family protein [Aureimonas leprariae]
MVGSLLLRGMIVGFFAGLLAFGFARVFGEPAVDYAIGFEAQAAAAPAHAHDGAAAHSHGDEEELVSRETQAGLGLLTGVVVYGTAIGGLFALAGAFAFGRFGTLSPRAVSALVALAGFVALVLVPQLKYPANPPAVGLDETIALRTQLFFAVLIASLVATGLGLATLKLLAGRGVWTAGLAGAGAFLLVVAVAALALPAIDEVPAGFSGSVLWRFRLASLGIHAVLWTGLGLGFGVAAERLLGRAAAGGGRLRAA